ncbi:hypothetical protein PoB_005295300 [Plakobranchus ocellatus]|uniref:Uncharacterized protein n=1 Tax=Plakobranchus ocellatus TaxID=259542 RepID=A0AAV4C4W1_9GAST|nr:hypothetical protein PoB_005295300 [Plakobranchus ocellatus]
MVSLVLMPWRGKLCYGQLYGLEAFCTLFVLSRKSDNYKMISSFQALNVGSGLVTNPRQNNACISKDRLTNHIATDAPTLYYTCLAMVVVRTYKLQ